MKPITKAISTGFLCLFSAVLFSQQRQSLIFSSPFPEPITQLVKFDTDFASGSLQKVELLDAALIKTSARDSVWHLSYNLYSLPDPLNPVDTSLAPSARWFYFRMIGVKAKQLYLNFFLTDPVRPMYSFDGLHFERFAPHECIVEPRRQGQPGLRQVSVRFTRDTVFLAYFVPYTFDYLQQRLSDWKSTGSVIALDTIGYSYRGLPMQLLTITDPSVSDAYKKRVYIHGRTHTSETPSSWHLDGMIDAITANTPEGVAYRRQMIFYILPFTNPDGVEEGLSRSAAHGVNLEISYDRPDSLTVPEVRSIKKILERLTADRPLDLILNMHSQVESKATYWVHTAEATSMPYHRNQLLLANLTMFQNPWFGKNDLSFSDGGARYVEGWIWDRFGEQTQAITFETPYTYYQLQPNGDWVTIENLRQMGGKLQQTVGEYFALSTPSRVVVLPQKPKNSKQWDFVMPEDEPFIGDGIYVAKQNNAKITYLSPPLPAGHYQIYRWVPGKVAEVSPIGSNEWVYLEDFVQTKEGAYKREVKAPIGTYANALLIIALPSTEPSDDF
ncbi:MAG: hypothetical protein LBC84_05375 [Prevotellaceae bacterium]|jgi:hypothetical protein|nr:hypothetical protein [Prevotellaceae bacterium]